MGAKVVSGARLGLIESTPAIVEVKPTKIDALLGVAVPPKEMIRHLTLLGFGVSGLAKLKVRVPWWRPDVSNGSDVAEEIIKMVGLDALPATIPAWSPTSIQFDAGRALTGKVRELLRAVGLFELTTYSFISEDDLTRFGLNPAKHLKLKNPMSIEQAYMRSTMLPSLVKVMETNQRYAKQFGVSEISRVFVPSGKKGRLPEEPYKVAVAIMGDYFAVKAPLDLITRELRLDISFVPSKQSYYYPGRQADVVLGGNVIGTLGQLHPRLNTIKGNRPVSFMEIDLAPLIAAADSHRYAPLSRFPSIARDIAMVVDGSVLWADVVAAIKDELPETLLTFLSRYEGQGIPDGKISLALRVTLTNMERTLTDPEADAAADEIVKILQKKFNAELRS
jgi:phenylalanyl-tRNA synthetase beta chain